MMSENCEPFEILLSTWLDEGLDREDQRELLDHLTLCDGCRRFYREARSLEGFVALVEPTTAATPAPPEVWKEIERRALTPVGDDGVKWLPWVLAAAAALVAGIALPFVPWPSAAEQTAEAPIEIQLEGNPDVMTETRFVELTTELLQADRKYHFAMQDVMEAVIEGSWESEGGTSEGDYDTSESDEEGERSSRIRT